MNRIDWLWLKIGTCGRDIAKARMVGHLTDELHVVVDMLIISSILYEWSLANCCEGGKDQVVRLEVGLLQVSSLDLQQKVGGRVRVPRDEWL